MSIEYLAGYFDGEGCIHVNKQLPFDLSLVIASADKEVLEKFHRCFGGSLHFIGYPGGNRANISVASWWCGRPTSLSDDGPTSTIAKEITSITRR